MGNTLRALTSLGEDLARKEAPGMLMAMGRVIEDEMLRRFPVGPTGNLADSIKVTLDPGLMSAKVGPRAPHAHLIHLGHRVRVPRVGYGGKLKYWSKYFAKKMHGRFLEGKAARPNPWVTVAADAKADAAIDAAADHVHDVIRKYEVSSKVGGK
jgi:hypothetical protein